MKYKMKQFLTFVCIVILACAMTGCSLFGNSKKNYSNYVQSLLDVNYKADYTQYMEITGSSQEDAEKVYSDGLDYLADALMDYYGIQDVEGSDDLHSQFVELAKKIYANAKYEITDVNKTDGTYTIDITIYPIDILSISYDEVVAYIEDFNDRIAAGDYNEYDMDQYETEYATGIIEILNNAVPNIGNGDGTTVTVTIIDDGEYYYISDADFVAIDTLILDNSATPANVDDATTAE